MSKDSPDASNDASLAFRPIRPGYFTDGSILRPYPSVQRPLF